jgi:hypothetical protein
MRTPPSVSAYASMSVTGMVHPKLAAHGTPLGCSDGEMRTNGRRQRHDQ